MKKPALLPVVLTIMLITACGAAITDFPTPMDHNMMMEGMPCHQMPDGSWMGECDEDSSADGERYDDEVGLLPEAKESSVVELNDGDRYAITAQIVSKEIKGKRIKMLGYNGMIPGPMLKVQRGSTVTIDFTNETDEEAMFHSHGLRLDNANDGTALVQDPIPVGGSFSYELTFPDTGIYWYHPHLREDYTQELGLYGNYLVQSEDPDYWSPVNRELPLVLDDLLMKDGSIAPFYQDFATHTLMGRYGNTYLINGSDDYQVEVKKGEVVRFYVTNVSNARSYRLAFPGARMKLVGADASKYLQESFTEAVVLSPSERSVIEVVFEESGIFDLMNDIPDGAESLGKVIVVDEEPDTSYLAAFEELRSNSDVADDIEPFRPYFDREPDKNLRLSMTMGMMGGGMMGSIMGMDHSSMDHGHMQMTAKKIEWQDDMGAMNSQSTSENLSWKLVDEDTGKENMNIDWQFQQGDVVKIRIFNDPNSMHPMQHPIHLHGQRFLVLETNGVRHENLAWKDTVMVPAGDTVDILVDMSNPGKWMLHCHIAEHLEADMMLGFEVLPL